MKNFGPRYSKVESEFGLTKYPDQADGGATGDFMDMYYTEGSTREWQMSCHRLPPGHIFASRLHPLCQAFVYYNAGPFAADIRFPSDQIDKWDRIEGALLEVLRRHQIKGPDLQ